MFCLLAFEIQTHTGKENPFNNDRTIVSHYFIKPSKILKKRKRSLGTFSWCAVVYSILIHGIWTTIKVDDLINGSISNQQYIPWYAIEYFVCIEICFARIRSHGSTKKKKRHFLKRNSAKFCFLFCSFGDQLKIWTKKKNTKISTIHPRSTLLSLFQVILIFEIPVFFLHTLRTLDGFYSASYNIPFCSINGVVG